MSACERIWLLKYKHVWWARTTSHERVWAGISTYAYTRVWARNNAINRVWAAFGQVWARMSTRERMEACRSASGYEYVWVRMGMLKRGMSSSLTMIWWNYCTYKFELDESKYHNWFWLSLGLFCHKANVSYNPSQQTTTFLLEVDTKYSSTS